MYRINVKNPMGSDYNIHIEKGFSLISDHIKEIEGLDLSGRKICIITDSNVGPLYADEVKKELLKVSSRVDIFTFPAGEQNKTLDTVKEAYKFLVEGHYDRKDILAALGGGVTGDLCGYVSATYLRGVDFIQIPTTLLSEVDSSIGGKTGVDFDAYKNMVGAFHMPRMVYMNPLSLNTLNEREFACGMAEIIKHGLIKDEDYYRWIIDHTHQIKARDFDTVSELVYKSCLIKAFVVEKDPTEQGIRAHLNFGHTIGHALEKYMDFSLLHGECVAFGCVAASYISFKRGLISEKDFLSLKNTFKDFDLPVSFDDLCTDRVKSEGRDRVIENITNLTASDKKADKGRVKFVLLNSIGESFTDKSVDKEEMAMALNSL